jgi:hypothetical protein
MYRVIQPKDPKSSEENAVDNEEDSEMGGNKSDGSKTEPPVRVPSGVADSLQTPSPDVSTSRKRPTAKLAPSGVRVYGQRCGLHSSAIVRAAFKGAAGHIDHSAQRSRCHSEQAGSQASPAFACSGWGAPGVVGGRGIRSSPGHRARFWRVPEGVLRANLGKLPSLGR